MNPGRLGSRRLGRSAHQGSCCSFKLSGVWHVLQRACRGGECHVTRSHRALQVASPTSHLSDERLRRRAVVDESTPAAAPKCVLCCRVGGLAGPVGPRWPASAGGEGGGRNVSDPASRTGNIETLIRRAPDAHRIGLVRR